MRLNPVLFGKIQILRESDTLPQVSYQADNLPKPKSNFSKRIPMSADTGPNKEARGKDTLDIDGKSDTRKFQHELFAQYAKWEAELGGRRLGEAHQRGFWEAVSVFYEDARKAKAIKLVSPREKAPVEEGRHYPELIVNL